MRLTFRNAIRGRDSNAASEEELDLFSRYIQVRPVAFAVQQERYVYAKRYVL